MSSFLTQAGTQPQTYKQRTGESQFHIPQFATSRFHFNVYALQSQEWIYLSVIHIDTLQKICICIVV